MARWMGLLGATDASEPDKLIAVQRFFAGFDQREDETRWGVPDYWALPQEFVRVGAGDCEDFAIAKYTTLIALGVPSDRLMLAQTHAYSTARRRIERHMVLAYRTSPSGSPWILDNRTRTITPLSVRVDLGPISSTSTLRTLELELGQIGRSLAGIAAQGKSAPATYAVDGPVPVSLSSVRFASSPGSSGQ